MIKPISSGMISMIVALSFFMEAVDSTVINTAIPTMAQSLGVEAVDLKAALISYLLGLAIFIPISGWLSDKFGVKRVFISALMIFTFSSMACGFSGNIIHLTIARFIQGIGGALGLPVGRLILIRTFGREHYITTMNNVVMVGAVGMVLGPVIGGVMSYYLSWHWIFWLNIPIGITACLLAYCYLTDTTPAPVPSLDFPGFLLFGLSLAGLTFALSVLSETTVRTSVALGVLGVSLLTFFMYAIHSRQQSHPIVKTQLLQIRTFKISVIGNLISRLSLGGIPFLIPLLLQINLGFSPQLSGLLLAPTALGVILGKPFALPILRLFGYKHLLMLSTVFASIMIGSFSIINHHTSLYVISSLTFLYGLILSLQYSAMNSLAYADLSSDDLSAANSIMSTLQQLAQSLGVAVSALLIRFFSFFNASDVTLTPSIFHDAFLTMALLTLISTGFFIRLKQDDGREMLKG